MGCASSKEDRSNAIQDLRNLASPPGGHGGQQETDLTSISMQNALRRVAQYLHQKRKQLTIIAVGGAVNTLLLESRSTTHDLDFFNNSLQKQDVQLIRDAARYARTRDPSLPEEWLNNRTTLFIRPNIRASLTDEAIRQNELVFRAPGLLVLAAPWHYAFCAKLDRISGSSSLGLGKRYDLTDAVAYLHRFLATRNKQTVSVREVESWVSQFGTRIAPGVIERVNAEFQRTYHWIPITG